MPDSELKKRILLKTAPTLGALTLKGLCSTWSIREGGYTAASPLSRPKEPKIYAVWHEVALAAGFYSGWPLHALASQSYDGELISRTLLKLGWLKPARGSSSKGGSSGMLEMQEFLKRGEHVLLTVDGPRGPRHQAKYGAIKLARLTGMALVPVAFACSPQIRLKSWDRMLIPPPLTNGVFWFGEELRFNPGEEDVEPEEDLQLLQKALELASLNAGIFVGDVQAAA